MTSDKGWLADGAEGNVRAVLRTTLPLDREGHRRREVSMPITVLKGETVEAMIERVFGAPLGSIGDSLEIQPGPGFWIERHNK